MPRPTLALPTTRAICAVLALWLALVSAPVSAQDALTVGGTVRQAGDRAPLVGLLVELVDLDTDTVLDETWTDDEARFQFDLELDDAARLELRIDEPGFEPLRVELDPGASGDALDLFVTPDDDASGYRYETRSARRRPGTVPTTVGLTREAIEALPGNRADPLAALQSLPGFARTSLGTSHVGVHGSAPQDVRAWLDGIPLPRAFHAGGLRALLPSTVLDAVTVHAGQAPVRLASGLGGAVELELREPSRDQHHGRVGVDFVDASVFAASPVAEHAQITVALRRSLIEAVAPVLADATGVDAATVPRWFDGLVRLTTQPMPRHELDALLFVGNDGARLDITFDSGGSESLEGESKLARFAVRHAWHGDRLDHELVYSAGTDTNDARDDLSRYEMALTEHFLRETLRVRADDRLTLELGADLTVVDGHHRTAGYIQRVPVLVHGPITRRTGAGFLEARITPLDDLTVTLGGRVEATNHIDPVTADLRGDVTWRFAPGSRLWASAGTASQDIPVLDEALLDAPAVWQRALHVALGADWRLPFYEPLTLEVSAYHVGKTELVGVTEDPPWYDLSGLAQQGQERTVGLDVLLRHDLAHRVSGWIAYTLSRTEARRSPGAPWRRAPYDQTHSAHVVVQVALPDRWRVSAQFGFVTGAPYTPGTRELFGTVLGHRFDPAVEVDPFHRLDLRVDKTWLFDLWRLELWVDVENVYYHRNIELAGVHYTGRVFANRGLPILPGLGIAAVY